MKPIPTTYLDVQYRSRLEAKWAVFFDELGVNAFYEPSVFNIGEISYTPDFIIHGLRFPNKTNESIVIAEIKPLTPNNEYIEYLKKVRTPGKSDFLVFIGPPSFEQPNGVWIYGANGNYVQHGFSLDTCNRCGYYAILAPYGQICECVYCPPNPDWRNAAEKANDFRFDL